MATFAPRSTSARAVAARGQRHPRPPDAVAPSSFTAGKISGAMAPRPGARRDLLGRRERQPKVAVDVSEERLDPHPRRPSSASRRSRVNFVLISVRISSPSARRRSRSAPAMFTRLLAVRPQAHLDPGVGPVEEGHVLEGVGIEVGVELAVDHVQHVAVELGGHAGPVVVGRLQDGPVLRQVGAEHQAAAAGPSGAQALQEGAALRRIEVADRPPEEGEQRAGRPPAPGRGRARSRPTTPCTSNPG